MCGGAGRDVRRSGGDLRGDGPGRRGQPLPGRCCAGGRNPESAAAQRDSRQSAEDARPAGSESPLPSALSVVPDAEGADRVLLIADEGVAQPAVTVTPRPVLDETRRLATVTADDDTAEVLLFEGILPPRFAASLDRAAVAVACDSLGLLSRQCSPRRSRYAKVRQQFGEAHRLVPGR